MSKRCLGCMKLIADEYNICPHCGYVVGTPADEPIRIVPGTLFHNRYIIGKVLGSGGFGATYLAWDGKLEQKVAIKEYMPNTVEFILIFDYSKCEARASGHLFLV